MNRLLQFKKRSQLFIGTHNVTRLPLPIETSCRI